MPSFYVDDVDIDVDDFLSACSDSEIRELVDALVEDGHIKPGTQAKSNKSNNEEFDDACSNLIGNSWRLSKEDEETILQISKKFVW
jgi:hypothetical protein